MADELDPLADALREALAPAYLLVRRLGQGGMGSVYLAREPALKRSVAVKVMLPDLARDETNRARFEREAQAVAAISHPNVVSVYRVGALEDGTPYFVMQYVQGRSLEDRLEHGGPLGMSEARRVLGEVASALAAAHKRDIVHRDIKPANILQDEDSGRVVVTDFGIAAVRSQESASPRLTQTGASLGTPTFMSPEQLLGEPVTDKSDVYSFGVLAFEVVTGAGPFRINSPHEAVAAHLRDTPPPLTRLRPDADPELEQIVASCLAKQPGERPTAAQIAQRLLPGERVSLEWPPPGLESFVGQLPRLSRQMAAGSLLFAVATAGLLLRNPDTGKGLPVWMAMVLVTLGALLVLRTVWSARALPGRVRIKEQRGHRVWTILETLCDRRGDTGALITGTREYIMLPPAARAGLRRRRVLAGALEGMGAALPIVSLLLAARVAAVLASPWLIAALTLAPALLALAAAWMLRWVEGRAVNRPRSGRRQRGDPAVARNVIETWTASLDAAASAQTMPTVSPRLTRFASYGVLGLVLIALVSASPLIMVDAVGSILARIAVPKSGTTIRRVRRALVGRDWSASVDVSITPAAAGAAFHALEMIGETTATRGMRAPLHHLHSPLEQPGTPAEFLRGRPIHPDTLLRLAARGALSAAERAFLETVAADPSFKAFSLVAHAPISDILEARYPDSTLLTVSWPELTIPRYDAVRSVAAAHTAVAALRLAQGRRQEAEILIREEVSFGLALLDRGIFLIDALIGSQIAGGALDRLEVFYGLTGRPDESRRLRAARDSAAALADRDDDAFERRVGQSNDAFAELRARLNLALADSTMPASYRWEFARMTAGESCFDAREMLFGPDRAPREALAGFARANVRSRSDSLLWGLVTAGSARIRPADYGNGPSTRSRIFQLSAGALGLPRLRYCASLLGIIT